MKIIFDSYKERDEIVNKYKLHLHPELMDAVEVHHKSQTYPVEK